MIMILSGCQLPLALAESVFQFIAGTRAHILIMSYRLAVCKRGFQHFVIMKRRI